MSNGRFMGALFLNVTNGRLTNAIFFGDFPLPEIATLIEQTIVAGRVTNPNIRCVGVSVNTSKLSEEQRAGYLAETAENTGLPCVDPVATGVGPLVDHLVESFK